MGVAAITLENAALIFSEDVVPIGERKNGSIEGFEAGLSLPNNT
jgi:hypothetical protein